VGGEGDFGLRPGRRRGLARGDRLPAVALVQALLDRTQATVEFGQPVGRGAFDRGDAQPAFDDAQALGDLFGGGGGVLGHGGGRGEGQGGRRQVAARWSYGGGVGRSHGVSSWSSREAPPVVRSAPWMGWVDGLQAEDMGSVV